MITSYPFLGVWGKRVRFESEDPVTLTYVEGDSTGVINGSTYHVSVSPKKPYVVLRADDGTTQKNVEIPLVPIMGVVAEIIKEYTGLSDQAITLFNNKFDIPKDNGIYLALGLQSTKYIGNNFKHKSAIGLDLVNTLNISDTLNLKLTGRDIRTIQMSHQLVMALNSDYSRQMQSLFGFKVSTIPSSMNNVSIEEGSSMIYMFNITINLMYSIEKVTSVKYYDKFNNEIIRG